MKFYVTFGTKYADEPHPHFPSINPDGWVEVEAENESVARQIIYDLLGDKWAFIYSEDSIEKIFFPAGCIATAEQIKKLNLPTLYKNTINGRS